MIDHPNFVAIERERQSVFAKLRQFLDGQLAATGHYTQLLVSPIEQLDGTRTRPFDRTRKPTDEEIAWPDFPDFSRGVLCQYYVHRHDGPASKSFTIGCKVAFGGQVWAYEEQDGLSRNWQVEDAGL